MCAGNGGKALALASEAIAEGSGATVWCHDVDEYRLRALAARFRKAGMSKAARTTGGDLAALPAGRSFDVVLVDAPCSGTGVIRRGRVMDCYRAGSEAEVEEAVAALVGLQGELLREGAGRAKDRLVYATCSTLFEENGAVAAAFESSAEGAGWIPWPFDGEKLEGCEGNRRTLLPSRFHDGFFIARWRRRGEA